MRRGQRERREMEGNRKERRERQGGILCSCDFLKIPRFVGHTGEPCRNGGTKRDVVCRGADRLA